MNHIKLKNVGVSLLMVLFVALTPAGTFKVWANAADQNSECTLKLEIPEDSIYFEDADRPDISVKLYQITATAGEKADLLRNDMGEEAERIFTSSKPDLEKAAEIVSCRLNGKAADHTIDLRSGSGSIGDISPGIYFVTADPVKNDEYEYCFQPYLVEVSEAQNICELKIGRSERISNDGSSCPSSAKFVFAGSSPVKTQDELMDLFWISQGALICGAACVVIAWKKHKKI